MVSSSSFEFNTYYKPHWACTELGFLFKDGLYNKTYSFGAPTVILRISFPRSVDDVVATAKKCNEVAEQIVKVWELRTAQENHPKLLSAVNQGINALKSQRIFLGTDDEMLKDEFSKPDNHRFSWLMDASRRFFRKPKLL